MNCTYPLDTSTVVTVNVDDCDDFTNNINWLLAAILSHYFLFLVLLYNVRSNNDDDGLCTLAFNCAFVVFLLATTVGSYILASWEFNPDPYLAGIIFLKVFGYFTILTLLGGGYLLYESLKMYNNQRYEYKV